VKVVRDQILSSTQSSLYASDYPATKLAEIATPLHTSCLILTFPGGW